MNKRTEKLLPNNKPKWIRVYDNGGVDNGGSADRYTVIFSGRYTHKTGGEHWLLAMSEFPYHPQGVGLHLCYPYQCDAIKHWPPVVGRKCHLGLRITFDDLPKDCQQLVMKDYCYLWDI